MPKWEFERLPPALVEQGLTQRDQFNNDDVELAEALVREVIQNSNDAAAGAGNVKVRFGIRSLGAGEALRLRQYFTDLLPHLHACGIDPAPLARPDVRVLVIEDFGTKGLTGNPAARDNDNFDRFWRQHGISGKGGRAGGRWGLGKLVFSSASEIRAFFGLTIRVGQVQPLLMGQAVLSNHQLAGHRYPAHGFWFADRAADNLQLPITDAAVIGALANLSGVSRTGQPGLSLIIPYLSASITDQTLVRGVLRNYYFPILAARLSVEVGSTLIDKDTFHRVAAEHNSEASIPLFFVERVSEAIGSAPEFGAETPINGASLTSSSFQPDTMALMRALYGNYGLLHVRVPVRLKRKDGTNQLSSIDLFLTRLPEEAKPFALFARGSITVPAETKFFSGAHAYGAMVASEDNVVAFLGDAENPAHTGWNANAEKLAANWRSPSQTLRHVRHALRDLYGLVAESIEHEDRDALVDFFALIDPATSNRGPKKHSPKPKIKLSKREKALVIKPKPGGFAILPGPGAANWKFPKMVDVRVAYDIVSGDPFKRHSKFDFDFSEQEIQIDLQNMEANPVRANKLRLTVGNQDFKLEASGFDTNRDIVVDARTV